MAEGASEVETVIGGGGQLIRRWKFLDRSGGQYSNEVHVVGAGNSPAFLGIVSRRRERGDLGRPAGRPNTTEANREMSVKSLDCKHLSAGTGGSGFGLGRPEPILCRRVN